jgi:predicted nucleotidyltransferase
MGHPPIRVELLTTISGVEFEECYADRKLVDIDGVEVSIISLEDLKRNKTASGRHKDLDDLDHL